MSKKEETAPKKTAVKEAPKREAVKTEAHEAAPKEAVKREAPKREIKREAPREVKPASKGSLGHGVGRRKAAIARVWLKRGSGALIVNDKEYVKYFDTELSRAAAAFPFEVYPQGASRYDAHANVIGGGLPSQADAVKLGLARALLEMNPELRPLLKSHGLLTVDSRVKERKKYGQKAARRKFQFVKR